jgi:hypothetical protein
MTTINEALSANLGPIQSHLEKLPERFRAQAQSAEYERLRTRKMVRIPVLSGIAAAGVLNMGGDQGLIRCGPDQGYSWSLSMLAIEGLTTGASQDTVQIFRNSATGQGRLIWQLTGNQPVSTFGKGQQILKPGEALLVVSVGAFASTVEVTLSGMAREVMAEREGEFF